VNSCVAQGFNAITIQPADNAALAPAMKKAAEAGLIVVSHYDMDPALGINDLIYQVLFGQKASGVLEAEEYVKAAGDSGKVAIIAGLTGADNAQKRTEGMMEVFAKYPNIEVVQTVYCDWDRQKAMAAAEDIMTAHPDIKAFIVQDDGMAWGVYAAIEAAGKTDSILIASQGFYESSIPAIQEGKFMFTISYPAGFFARDAMDVIKKVSDGETVDRVMTLGMLLVTKDNVETAPHD
jgi:ABC-type sugar transport system substrate-binding protein